MILKSLIAATLLLSIQAHAVTTMDENEAVKLINESKLPVVMEVFATWCEPCKSTAPLLDQAEKNLKGKAIFIKVDLDKSPQLQKVINAIPFIAIFKKGHVVKGITGAPPDVKALEKTINSAIDKK